MTPNTDAVLGLGQFANTDTVLGLYGQGVRARTITPNTDTVLGLGQSVNLSSKMILLVKNLPV